MESIRQIYKIGHGPSSSHTMGPQKASGFFAKIIPSGTARLRATLYGALAATGRGHLTDQAILSVLNPLFPTEIVWKPETVLSFHTNGMTFEALDVQGNVLASKTYYSIGGGDIVEEGLERPEGQSIYPLTKIKDIQALCEKNGLSYWEYVNQCEGPEIWDYLHEVWTVMKEAVERGIEADIIVMHPYDRWGFSVMNREQDDLYWNYVIARFSVYRNVWWSLANEYDLMRAKKLEDWEHYADLLCKKDPYNHMRSIHNCIPFYDHTRPLQLAAPGSLPSRGIHHRLPHALPKAYRVG